MTNFKSWRDKSVFIFSIYGWNMGSLSFLDKLVMKLPPPQKKMALFQQIGQKWEKLVIPNKNIGLISANILKIEEEKDILIVSTLIQSWLREVHLIFSIFGLVNELWQCCPFFGSSYLFVCVLESCLIFVKIKFVSLLWTSKVMIVNMGPTR